MGGVHVLHTSSAISEDMVQRRYNSIYRKTTCWYSTVIFHFLDIATTNAYIFHCELASTWGKEKLSHEEFMAELVTQMCGVDKTELSQSSRSTDHIPIPITVPTDHRKKASKGCRTCPTVTE
ncbi:hypothetical protein LDENG_00178820 [Lucifuga dentata]|nr:hypothetical protein LDENG_00178820 [Lucifuga dentata]